MTNIPVITDWLSKHARLHLHFTLTGSSWLNRVERFFADLTGDVVREGSFTSVAELSHAIEAYLAERNAHPKPYAGKRMARLSSPKSPALVRLI